MITAMLLCACDALRLWRAALWERSLDFDSFLRPWHNYSHLCLIENR